MLAAARGARRAPSVAAQVRDLSRARKPIARPAAAASRAVTVAEPALPAPAAAPAPAPAIAPTYGPWEPVLHKESGGIYYWNRQSNEVTAVGQLPPGVYSAPAGAVGQPQQPGLGRVLAEGAAWGVGMGMGSSIARGIVGSIFGGGGDDVPEAPEAPKEGDDWV
jgi:hypothetical protein